MSLFWFDILRPIISLACVFATPGLYKVGIRVDKESRPDKD